MNIEVIYFTVYILTILGSWVFYYSYLKKSYWQDRLSELIETRSDFLKWLVLIVLAFFVIAMASNLALRHFPMYGRFLNSFDVNYEKAFVAFVGILFGSFFLQYGFHKMTEYVSSRKIRFSRIGLAPTGLVEIQGQVVSEHTLLTPYSKIPCVFYRAELQECRERYFPRGSSYPGSSYHYWKTISSDTHRIPFWLKDETGHVQIDPIDAEFNVIQKQSGNLDTNSNNASFALGAIGSRRYSEVFLSPNETVCILGTLGLRKITSLNRVVYKGNTNSTFIISHNSQKDLVVALQWQMLAGLIYGSLLFIAGTIRILSLLEVI